MLGRNHSKAEDVISGSMKDDSAYEALKSDVQLRVISVDSVSPEEREFYRALLSSDELLHLSRLKTEESKCEYSISRGALRESLGGYLSVDAASIKFVMGTFGKPYVSFPPMPHIEFNVSHSHGIIVFAFSVDRKLGIDIERIDPAVPNDQLIETVFTPEERRELRSLPSELFVEGFFTAWTRKEAFVKVTGQGFSSDLQAFSVTVDPRKPVILRIQDGSLTRDLEIRSLSLYPGFASAIAISRG